MKIGGTCLDILTPSGRDIFWRVLDGFELRQVELNGQQNTQR